MNLAEALNAALPDLPVRTVAARKLKLEPSLIVRAEEDEDGEPIAVIFVPERAVVYRLPKIQWDLLQQFDGERHYAEVAAAFAEQHGVEVAEAQIKQLVESTLETGLWHQSAQEKNITLSQKLADERRKRLKKKSRFGDLSHIVFKAWDPDDFLTRAHEHLGFVFTPWFTLLTLFFFGFMTYIFIAHWGEIGSDTLLFYNFTKKGFRDLVEFWVLFLIMAFFHESAHGLTCKHFGGEVHNMGFQLIYLTPAFAVDITEVWVRTGRWQRVIAIMAGIWIEMIFCAAATLVWWGTAPGSAPHEWAYKVMLITGVAVVVVNLNPLIKLDGYYAFTETIGMPELKEKSTAFVSGWVKRNVFRLPVEFDYVPSRRRWLYVPYAILSGAYSYLLLFAVSRFAYNVFSRWIPDLAFVPALLLALLIFRSRIRILGRFMKSVYLDKRERLLSRMTPLRWSVAALVAALVIFAPVWRKTITAQFVLEPHQRAVVRARVPGKVEEIYVWEGEWVTAGAPVALLRNLDVESGSANSRADLQRAEAMMTRAQLNYSALGAAQSELRRSEAHAQTYADELGPLQPVALIAGVVTSARLQDLKFSYLAEGAQIAEIDDLQTMCARLYLPEFEVRDLRVNAPAALHVAGSFGTIRSSVKEILPSRSDIAEALRAKADYAGLGTPNYFVVLIEMPNSGNLWTDMTGEAKVLVGHRSLAGFLWESLRDFTGRKLW